jgi:hypothetical protein
MFTESKSDFIDTNDFAEEITYTPYGGSPVTIEVVINEDFPNQQDYERGTNYAFATITAHNDDISSPKRRDRFTFHGYNWEVGTDAYQVHGDFLTVNLVRELV